MFKGTILTFICCILFVTGKPNLIFLEGTEKLVSSIKIIRNGTNFTVTCLIEGLKSKRKSLDLIFWTNGDLSRQRREVNSITLYIPGTYYCICDKYKLIKRLQLIVRDEHDFMRRKRSQYRFGIPLESSRTQIPPINYPDPIQDLLDDVSKTSSNKNNNNNQNSYIDRYLSNLGGNFLTNNGNYEPNYKDNVQTRYPGITVPPINYPDPIQDLFDDVSKTSSNRNNNNNQNSYIDGYLSNSGGNFLTNNDNYEPNYKDNVRTRYPDTVVNYESDHSPPIYVSEHKDGFNVIYFFAIVLAFVIISLLIYCMSRKRNEQVTNATMNNNGNISNTNNHIEYCTHVTCARHRNSNPEVTCYLATLNSSGHVPLSTIHHNDGGVTILTSLIANNDSTDSTPAIPYSDSPPAYGISSRNPPLHSTREDVPNENDLPPPSYNQAVANMNLGPPPDFNSSVNQTSLPNVDRARAPLIRAHAMDPEV